MGGGYYPIGQGHGVHNNQPYANQSYQGAWNQPTHPRLPFLTTLNPLNLSRLTNDHVSHNLAWSVVPTKLPLDIPKFEGNSGEDPGEHAMTFDLWCSSNSLNDDSISLRLFQCTLMGPTMKWYIELPGGDILFIS